MVSRRNKAKTFAVFLLWITKGLYLEALGPAMIDLRLIYATNYASVTRAVAGRGAGCFIGAAVGGVLIDRWPSLLELWCAVFTTVAGLGVSMVTYLPSIDHVWLLYLLLGAASSIVNIAGTKLALSMWKEKSSIILQLLHMGFGVGALLGPLMCTPFLAVMEQNGTQPVRVVTKSRVHVAFLLIGIITLLVAVPFYSFQFTNHNHSKNKNDSKTEPMIRVTSTSKTWKDHINPASYADGNFTFGACVFLFISFYFFVLVGGEKTYVSFVRTISVDVFKLGKNEASYLNSVFWMSLTGGRFVGSFVSHFVSTRAMITVMVLLNAISSTLCNMYGLTDAQVLWVFTVLEGFLIAPMYPLGVAYSNSLINLSGFCLMLIALMGGLGDMMFLWSAGRVYDQQGAPAIFRMVNAAFALLAAVLLVFRIATRSCTTHTK
ncbi:sodium-dependent glucose transporter 1-like [Mya arenaria]|uniref:sodium-dependent glucose transporter 1-like n=1 Tax=Mya arenaria TaxID=6604 RepID=UPI0022DF1C82|nr:sodium-dependent glucose transporter 1-like [Mya arenaria]XP_052811851.1 sodium-dependent glucose transporter 1-like [Mya arenaria]